MKIHNFNGSYRPQESLFKVKHLGSIWNYLGLEVTRNNNECFELCQEGKIKQLLNQYSMADVNNVNIPMTTSYVKEK